MREVILLVGWLATVGAVSIERARGSVAVSTPAPLFCRGVDGTYCNIVVYTTFVVALC